MTDVEPNAKQRLLRTVLDRFAIYGDLESAVPFGKGHINDTFVSTWNQGGTRLRYTHQRINERVFTRPGEVMENILRVTNHIRGKLEGVGDRSRRVLTVVPAADGKPFVRDAEGGWWRSYCFIENARGGDLASSPEEAALLGKSVGRFQNQLADIGGERLFETIPGFHNMETRYTRFHEALQKNGSGRAGGCRGEIDFLLENEKRGGLLIRSLWEGTIPERICHDDTKMNNILLDETTGEALCVIDLDTVMPGTSLFDLGDLIRSVATRVGEDEQDLSGAGFDPALFRALVEGYFSEARSFLTPAEYALVCESGRSMTQIMALRFLTDYLEGDHYYHIDRPLHNLDRCRSQIALIRSMDSQWEEAEKTVRELAPAVTSENG
ncbi:MAG: aminoglycoside phosphotransferase family protein [Treponema sp.]|jgi:Ser/Thr protein kinase RdoA (MazF antagonist)|nr:aminoglycoside phosphotransferase family protein [Treponema sp.]